MREVEKNSAFRKTPGLRLAFFFALETAGILATSALCDYRFLNPGQVVNLAIASMLTPIGLLSNFFWGTNPELLRFYARENSRSAAWNTPTLAVAVLGVISVSFLFLVRERGSRR